MKRFLARRKCGLAACLALMLLFASCASAQKQPREAGGKTTVVLLPDEQGKTGSVVVSAKGGKQVLSAPRQGVEVSAGAPPGKPFVLSNDDLQSQVGAAIKALPPPPFKFILYFHWDSDKLTRKSSGQIPAILRRIKERTPVEISVVGHTDTVGDKEYNYGLSLMRARSIAAILTEKGVDPAILEISSHGKDNPLIPTGDQVSEPRNRRVEVTVK
jgi:outer membrane protein OmpA-like peptidoglycan-associated protein